MSETEERQWVIAEALTWENTPYHHRAAVKGPKGGVDCAMLLKQVFVNAGLVADFTIPNYPPDWMLHRGEEIFLNIVQRYCTEFAGPPEPGDIMLCRVARLYAHGAIVLAWPKIIHAFKDARFVIQDDANPQSPLMSAKPRFFSYWRKPA